MLPLFQAFMGNEKLSGFFSVLSTNIAQNGLEFVSTVEDNKTRHFSHLKPPYPSTHTQCDWNVIGLQAGRNLSTGYSGIQKWAAFSGTLVTTFLFPAMLSECHPYWLNSLLMRVITVSYFPYLCVWSFLVLMNVCVCRKEKLPPLQWSSRREQRTQLQPCVCGKYLCI